MMNMRNGLRLADASDAIEAHLRWAIHMAFDIAGPDGPLLFAGCFGADTELDYYS